MAQFGAFMNNKKFKPQAQTAGAEAVQPPSNLQTTVQAQPPPARGQQAGLMKQALERAKAPKLGLPSVPATTPATDIPPSAQAPPAPAFVRPPALAGQIPATAPAARVPGGFEIPTAPVVGGLADWATAAAPAQFPGVQPYGAQPPAPTGPPGNVFAAPQLPGGYITEYGRAEAAPGAPARDEPFDARQDQYKRQQEQYTQAETLGQYFGGGGVDFGNVAETIAKTGPQESVLGTVEEALVGVIAGEPEFFTAEELAAQDKSIDKWQAQAAFELSEQMAARGMGASGIAAYGMGQIASQAEEHKLNLRIQNKQNALDQKLKELQTFGTLYANILTTENQADLNEAIMKLTAEKDQAGDVEAIKNNILADLFAKKYDTEALAWLDKALNDGMSQSDAISNLQVDADGTITVINPLLGTEEHGDAEAAWGDLNSGEASWLDMTAAERENAIVHAVHTEGGVSDYFDLHYGDDPGELQGLAAASYKSPGKEKFQEAMTKALGGKDPAELFGADWVDVCYWMVLQWPAGSEGAVPEQHKELEDIVSGWKED